MNLQGHSKIDNMEISSASKTGIYREGSKQSNAFELKVNLASSNFTRFTRKLVASCKKTVQLKDILIV